MEIFPKMVYQAVTPLRRSYYGRIYTSFSGNTGLDWNDRKRIQWLSIRQNWSQFGTAVENNTLDVLFYYGGRRVNCQHRKRSTEDKRWDWPLPVTLSNWGWRQSGNQFEWEFMVQPLWVAIFLLLDFTSGGKKYCKKNVQCFSGCCSSCDCWYFYCHKCGNLSTVNCS